MRRFALNFVMPPSLQRPPATASRRVAWSALVLLIATISAYLTSFRGVFVLDDLKAIVENPTIRDWRRLDLILNPGDAGGSTIGGRPLVNLTLALNRLVSGTDPWSYHAVNLAIHVAATLLLFGLVRRTLSARGVGAPSLTALTVAALWALHPLQTESVTYVSQRAESLCGLFYLATLYGFARAVDAEAGGDKPAGRWMFFSFLSCLAGMATKEVMVTAPVIVLLYDRTFAAGTFAAAWRQRGRFHLALAATWLLLALLVLGASERGGTAGLGSALSPWQYAATQVHAIPHYLHLIVWPHPLVFDYGTPAYAWGAVWGEAVVLVGMGGATVWALVQRPTVGFLGAALFLVLAPSSTVVPVATQTMAEHRMYLPLAAVLTLIVTGAHGWLGGHALKVLLAAALVSGGLTARRNLAYVSEGVLWADTVAHAPTNHRARTNLGIALTLEGRLAEAEAQFREAFRLEPNDAAIPANLCNVIGQQGRIAEAVAFGETAVKLDPHSLPARINLAHTLDRSGNPAAAISHFEAAYRLDPATPAVAQRLGALLFGQGNQAASAGDFATAIARYRRALAVTPDAMPVRSNLGNALLVSGRVGDAITEYRAVLAREPDNARVQQNLARALAMPESFER